MLGLARSGRAARWRCGGAGSRSSPSTATVARRRRAARRASTSARQRGRVGCSTAPTCSSRARACPARRRSSRPRARAASRSGARSSSARAPRGPDRRRDRHERQDDDDRAARRDLPRGGPAGRGGGQRRHAAHRELGRRRRALVVCELSSFQLEDVHELRPRVAVLLNLEPDHLDRHGTIEAYRDAKLRLFEKQTADDVAVVPRGLRAVPGEAPRRVRLGRPAAGRAAIPGPHNRENAAAATAAARAPGSTTTRSPRRCATSPACRTGSSRSASATACGS